MSRKDEWWEEKSDGLLEMGGRTGRWPVLVEARAACSRDALSPMRIASFASADRLDSRLLARLVDALGYADWIGLSTELEGAPDVDADRADPGSYGRVRVWADGDA